MGYKLGILGGMGPLATATLYKMIVTNTFAATDQDHIEMVILNKCSIPDRSQAILNNTESPVDKINEGIEELIKLDCKYFIIPCNTAHCFKSQFKNLDKITFIDMIEETQKELCNQNNNIVVLCTDGTRKIDVYGKYFKKGNKNVLYPETSIQNKVMDVIINTKAGIDKYQELKEVILNYKNETILLACTELSVYYETLKSDNELSSFSINDAMNILSCAAIITCEKKLK